MKIRILWVGVAVLAAIAVNFRTEPAQAKYPEIFSIVEGKAFGDSDVAIVVIGKRVNRYKEFEFRDPQFAFLGFPKVQLRTSSMLVLTAPNVGGPGSYSVVLSLDSKGRGKQTRELLITKGEVVPGRGVYTETGDALVGEVTTPTGTGSGVKGRASSVNAVGVMGSDGSADGGRGVLGQSANGIGVQGICGGNSSNSAGVSARSTGPLGAALIASWEGTATTAPTTFSGNIAVFRATPTGGGATAQRARIDRDGRGYFTGGTQTSGADFAESVDVEGAAESYEPGDVMVVSANGARRFARSESRLSPLVAGVYSTKPALLGSAHPDVAGTDDATDGQIPLGIVGIVPTKVCDENGPIRAGDLLVTSSVPGHAMRAPRRPRPGTILGKALGELRSGTGRIEILLSLQ